MILKVVDENNGTIGAVQVYENNENGELTVQDTHHIRALEYGSDDVFGTNDEEVIVIVDITEYKENCLLLAKFIRNLKMSMMMISMIAVWNPYVTD